ncbi:hypothetical protein FQN54_008659 [Arachnomyces sp. PD_36]|nr:hypothetical protein FQN54_008659 [Arachnomyces sp. PD_36]
MLINPNIFFISRQWPLIAIPLLLWPAVIVMIRILGTMKSPLPGPKLAKYTGWWIRLKSIFDPSFGVQTIHHLHERYGPIVQVAPKQISFCHANALRDIYAGPRGLDSSADMAMFQQFGSVNLVSTTDADLHRTRRNHVARLYSGPSVTTPEVQEIFKAHLDCLMARLEENATRSPSRTVNIFPWIKWLTSDVMIQLALGSKNAPDLLRSETSRMKYQSLITTSTGGDNFDGLYALLLFWFPNLALWIPGFFKPQPKINEFGMKRTKEEFENQEFSASDLKPTTHLRHPITIYRCKGARTGIPDAKYVASDCMDHFFAGTATTTDLMAASIWRLSLPENKAYQKRLRQELRDAGVCSGAHPEFPVIHQLPFLTNVLRETLRLDSPVPFGLPRVVKKGQDITIMGVKIEPGTRISTPIYSLHRNSLAGLHRPGNLEPRPLGPTGLFTGVQADVTKLYPVWDRSKNVYGDEEYREANTQFYVDCSVAWAETRLFLARIYSTYETRLDQVWLDDNGALLHEKMRKKLYPATVEEPIEFRQLSEDSKHFK